MAKANVNVLTGIRWTEGNVKKIEKIKMGFQFFECDDLTTFVDEIGERENEFICKAVEANIEDWDKEKDKICLTFLQELLINGVYSGDMTELYEPLAKILAKEF
jgi:hypothetical protein